MKKILLILASSTALLAPVLALAAVTALPQKDIFTIIDNVAKIIYSILIAVAVIFILLGGIQFLTAGGDPEKIKTARDKIMYAVIAIIIGIAAWGIANLVTTWV